MKILFFLAHPAHYHLFKNTIRILGKSGHETLIVTKTKDVLGDLLKEDNIPFRNILEKEKKSSGKYRLLFHSIKGLLIRDLKLSGIVLKNRPDIMIGTDWSIAHVGKFFGIPSVLVNEDDTQATPENKYFYPFASTLLLPDCCDRGLWGKKRVTYNSYHELAYLHPNKFKPDDTVVLKFNPSFSPFAIVRMVKLTASHDINKKGLNKRLLDEIITKLSKKYKVFICSEKQLEEEYKQYQLTINPIEIHHALFYASIFIGDSQTMSAEAGVLGTPFIRYNDFVGKIGYLNELENKYNLGFGYTTDKYKDMLEKIDDFVTNKIDSDWDIKRKKMLSEKIDLTDFMVWFIENYPASINIARNNPEFLDRFH
jgi:predicted glycosyltransferase